VKVTVEVPPVQTSGAPVPLLEIAPLQPPLAETVASQAAYLASMAACVWQAASVTLAGQLSVTVAGAATVKVAVQFVANGAQLLL